MARVRVAVIFGGMCEEHAISVKSAQQVAIYLDRTTYDAVWIGITATGEWKLCDGPSPGWDRRGQHAILSPDRSNGGIVVLNDGTYTTITVDLVLPILHGRFGEDGSVQGLLELAGTPYVGCDVTSSAVCMDKSVAYALAQRAGIRTPRFWVVTTDDMIDLLAPTYPVFVKPARSGSSFGVSKVIHPDDMADALRIARLYDSKVVIEEAVVGREVGCAILGPPDQPVLGEIDRVDLAHGFFRIHQEQSPETGSENSTFIVPADISPDERELVASTARAIYRTLGCTGLARVDMFLTASDDVVLNEVNTLPGLTSYSRYPRMMQAAGLPMATVIDRLISTTLHTHRR